MKLTPILTKLLHRPRTLILTGLVLVILAGTIGLILKNSFEAAGISGIPKTKTWATNSDWQNFALTNLTLSGNEIRLAAESGSENYLVAIADVDEGIFTSGLNSKLDFGNLNPNSLDKINDCKMRNAPCYFGVFFSPPPAGEKVKVNITKVEFKLTVNNANVNLTDSIHGCVYSNSTGGQNTYKSCTTDSSTEISESNCPNFTIGRWQAVANQLYFGFFNLNNWSGLTGSITGAQVTLYYQAENGNTPVTGIRPVFLTALGHGPSGMTPEQYYQYIITYGDSPINYKVSGTGVFHNTDANSPIKDFNAGAPDAEFKSIRWEPVAQDPAAHIKVGLVASNNLNELQTLKQKGLYTWITTAGGGNFPTPISISSQTLPVQYLKGQYASIKIGMWRDDRAVKVTPLINRMILSYVGGVIMPGPWNLTVAVKDEAGADRGIIKWRDAAGNIRPSPVVVNDTQAAPDITVIPENGYTIKSIIDTISSGYSKTIPVPTDNIIRGSISFPSVRENHTVSVVVTKPQANKFHITATVQGDARVNPAFQETDPNMPFKQDITVTITNPAKDEVTELTNNGVDIKSWLSGNIISAARFAQNQNHEVVVKIGPKPTTGGFKIEVRPSLDVAAGSNFIKELEGKIDEWNNKIYNAQFQTFAQQFMNDPNGGTSVCPPNTIGNKCRDYLVKVAKKAVGTEIMGRVTPELQSGGYSEPRYAIVRVGGSQSFKISSFSHKKGFIKLPFGINITIPPWLPIIPKEIPAFSTISNITLISEKGAVVGNLSCDPYAGQSQTSCTVSNVRSHGALRVEFKRYQNDLAGPLIAGKVAEYFRDIYKVPDIFTKELFNYPWLKANAWDPLKK